MDVLACRNHVRYWLVKKVFQYLPVTIMVLPCMAMPLSTSPDCKVPLDSSLLSKVDRSQLCTTFCWAMLIFTTKF